MNSVKRVLPVYFVVFLGYIGYSLFLTIFAPIFLNSDFIDAPKNTRVIMLGILISLYPFGQFLSSPILGAISDRAGRRPILLYSLLVTAFAYIAVGIALTFQWIWLVYVALFVAGISEGNITIAQSAVADVSDKASRHRLFGYIYFAAACSYLVGPILGGWLANVKLWNGFSYELPFFLVAAMLLATFVWTWMTFKETLKKPVYLPYWKGVTNIKNLFVMKRFRFWFLVNFLIYMAVFGFLQGYPIYLVARYQVEVGQLSLMITWTDIPFLVVNLLLIDYIAKRFKPVNVLIFMVFGLSATMLVMLLPGSAGPFWILLIVAGLFTAITLPMSSSLVSLLANEDEQGRVMGVNQSLNFLTEALAGLGFGLLASGMVKVSMLFFAIMGFLAVILLALKKVFSRGRRRI
ncbi:MAG: hypothetical protein S4CHLAM45_05440 [Chlamydiales bacterium]|nr:hypothetical protein [Chlamydiales bacterium]MCH9619915.1 hypothetical protein [Chlamydiales bacterium]MCH9622658.1 hypothetical protein [Chlamydiales bacterium]